ncbi:MAG: dihydropteroate synthase [Bacteroidota bacterium]
MLNPLHCLHCKEQILDLSDPVVMGILNVTPDSFFDGGRYLEESAILRQLEKMLEEGASIIDIGGMSSRPGAELISETDELRRVIPIILKIRQKFPQVILSIDTLRSKVAVESIAAGASIVNDISAGQIDEAMMKTVAELKVPYILMHMQGRPNTMQTAPSYQNVTVDILDFFIEKLGRLKELGVEEVVLDVGFGFGKTIEHNYQLLKNLAAFRILDCPLLVGLSRKSMIYKYLNISAENALNGTTALHMVALQNGAKILRVHDVKEAVEAIRLWKVIEAQELI